MKWFFSMNSQNKGLNQFKKIVNGIINEPESLSEIKLCNQSNF